MRYALILLGLLLNGSGDGSCVFAMSSEDAQYIAHRRMTAKVEQARQDAEDDRSVSRPPIPVAAPAPLVPPVARPLLPWQIGYPVPQPQGEEPQ